MKIAIIGCGYLGGRIARECLHEDDCVSALVCTEASASQLQKQGVDASVLDLDAVLPVLNMIKDSRVFYFAPPPRSGVDESRVQRFLAAMPPGQLPEKVVYLSTTGVYGDCGGGLVDEAHAVNPQADRAQRRFSGEQQFLAWGQQMEVSVTVLRVAGIYGPERLPLARLRRGEPMVCEAESPYTNRIYIDDLVAVCRAAMVRGVAGEIYNVSDGHPGNMTDYFNQVADFAGLPRPEQISLQQAQQQLSAGMLAYLKESRRLDNRKMLQQLGVVLRYPTLALGLKAIGSEVTESNP